jgi:hypothetical protein
MKRRIEKKQATRFLRDRRKDRRRERGHHLRWAVRALIRELDAAFKGTLAERPFSALARMTTS